MTPAERAAVIEEAKAALDAEEKVRGRLLTPYEIARVLEWLKSSATSSPAQQPPSKK